MSSSIHPKTSHLDCFQTNRPHFLRHQAVMLWIIAFGAVFSPVDALAQQDDISGRSILVDWPASRAGHVAGEPAEPLDYQRFELMPFIDTLAVHYRFSTPDSSSRYPSLHFITEWTEAYGGILGGRLLGPDEELPFTVIESMDLLFEVMVADEPVAEFFLPLDTIGLGPVPSMTIVDINEVAWDSIFVGVSEQQARQLFESGFTLSSPRIVRIAFFAPPGDDPETFARAGRMDSRPLERTVFVADFDLWFNWRDDRLDWLLPSRSFRNGWYAPRGEMSRSMLSQRLVRLSRSGGSSTAISNTSPRDEPAASSDEDRSTGDRGGQRSAESDRRSRGGGDGLGLADLFSGKKDSKDDDDDDDDSNLAVAAIAGVVAVGALAVLGGTVGYYGSTSKAPIGIMSGYVAPRWGAVLHAAVNREVFGTVKGPENVVLGLTGFYDVFNSALQPAVGLGVRITEEGTDHVVAKPNVSVGMAGNFGSLVVLAGVDVMTPDFRLGVGYNFRHSY